MVQDVVIRFFAPVIEYSINALIDTVDRKMKEGITKFTILISTPGGSVFHGLSAYNYLRGLPVEIITHNFGSVDSIGVILYCGGSKRLSVPQARFLIHPVANTTPANISLEEKQLDQMLKSLQIDTKNIAKVIAENTGKTSNDVEKAMHERITLNPEEAIKWGLVHEIKKELFEEGSEIISISLPPQFLLQQLQQGLR